MPCGRISYWDLCGKGLFEIGCFIIVLRKVCAHPFLYVGLAELRVIFYWFVSSFVGVAVKKYVCVERYVLMIVWYLPTILLLLLL